MGDTRHDSAGALLTVDLGTGHGTLGWTMAAGSGWMLADIMSGRRAEIDLERLGLERYGTRAGK